MYKNLLPNLDIQIAYKEKTSGDVVTVNETSTPLKRYPQSRYEKLYEIGTVQVSFY